MPWTQPRLSLKVVAIHRFNENYCFLLTLMQGMGSTVHKPHPLSSHSCAWQGVLEKPTLFAAYKWNALRLEPERTINVCSHLSVALTIITLVTGELYRSNLTFSCYLHIWNPLLYTNCKINISSDFHYILIAQSYRVYRIVHKWFKMSVLTNLPGFISHFVVIPINVSIQYILFWGQTFR